ncbi:MAG: hypothetical protein P8H62_11640 [Henriciella sp.]|nr:hypothetical protein [Henriciella sp.]
MQTEDNYTDLTALFEAQDASLDADTFVAEVMKPIRNRARWRTPLLFGAGGLGLGAAVSQISVVLSELPVPSTPNIDVSLSAAQESVSSLANVNPVWALAAGVVIVCLGFITLTERA